MYYYLLTDKVQVPSAKKPVLLVTIASEAFGLFTYENCRDKWYNICELRKDNKSKLHWISIVYCY